MLEESVCLSVGKNKCPVFKIFISSSTYIYFYVYMHYFLKDIIVPLCKLVMLYYICELILIKGYGPNLHYVYKRRVRNCC